MISVLKNEWGYIRAYCEWYILDERGCFKDGADYLWVHDLWIHPKHCGKKEIKKIIGLVNRDPLNTAKWVYWKNLKHNERRTPLYSRERLAKMGE